MAFQIYSQLGSIPSTNTQKNGNGGKVIMKTDTQQLIIILLAVIAVITLLKGHDITITTTIIGILGGFLTNKTLTEKQQEIIEQETREGMIDEQ